MNADERCFDSLIHGVGPGAGGGLCSRARRMLRPLGMAVPPRRATTDDAAALNALARAAYEIYVPIIGREPMPMAVDWASLVSVQEVWIIDGLSGEAVASLALALEPDHLVIWSVAVAPAHQGRGL